MADEANPYPEGSARWKIKQREIIRKRQKAAEAAAPRKEVKKNRPGVSADRAGRILKRRGRQIDEAVDAAQGKLVKKLRDRQSTDGNN